MLTRRWSGLRSVTPFLLKNEPTSVLYVARLSPRGDEATVKASLNRAFVAYTRPETRRASHDQDEAHVKVRGGPNPRAVQHSGMSCG